MFEVGQIFVSKFNSSYEYEVTKVNEETKRVSFKPISGPAKLPSCFSFDRFNRSYEQKWVPDLEAEW